LTITYEEFVFLISIERLQYMKKTEIISVYFFELSSGLLIIESLRKKGLVNKRIDIADERLKRISL